MWHLVSNETSSTANPGADSWEITLGPPQRSWDEIEPSIDGNPHKTFRHELSRAERKEKRKENKKLRRKYENRRCGFNQ